MLLSVNSIENSMCNIFLTDNSFFYIFLSMPSVIKKKMKMWQNVNGTLSIYLVKWAADTCKLFRFSIVPFPDL